MFNFVFFLFLSLADEIKLLNGGLFLGDRSGGIVRMLQTLDAAFLAAAIDAGDSSALTLTGYHALEPGTVW